ncbi:hypothetical protein ACFU90_37595 [Streptomyces noursei]|uniref:hypothetical protein n=1 Tax=Streptomyces noursei TaxID=1971 RepID=UPI0005C8D947|nr:hypothetical protein [Streptomyces noursei]
MTRTKKSLAVAAIAAAVLGTAAVPAMADNHIPGPPNTVTAQDNHMPMAPQDNHTPLAPQAQHARLAPMDNHMP